MTNHKKVSQKVFIVGFLSGLVLALVPCTKNILMWVSGLFYTGNINHIIFMLFWGVLLGGFLYGNYAIYIKEKAFGLVKVWLALAMLIIAMVFYSKFSV